MGEGQFAAPHPGGVCLLRGNQLLETLFFTSSKHLLEQSAAEICHCLGRDGQELENPPTPGRLEGRKLDT